MFESVSFEPRKNIIFDSFVIQFSTWLELCLIHPAIFTP